MEISAPTWTSLSKLLDEAFDLDPAARTAWLRQQTESQPELAPLLRRLLAAHASSETADVLARLPTLGLPTEVPTRHAGLDAGDRVGPYRLKRELGSGGMADVWLAERADGAFVRDVALKLPHISRLRRDLAARFARERDILARLEHPHIARLYDAGVADDGLPYLAMEFVDGEQITNYCDDKRLDVPARLHLFAQVLEAVQYAHANLIIHRDLKPSNILISAGGQVRLLDFGIAKLLADDDSASETPLTQLAGRALTPDYASPEQIRGESLTIASDVYSLGVVLYELLAGQRPYRLKLESAAQLEQAILSTDPAKPSGVITAKAARARNTSARHLARALAGDLDTIVCKALAKNPLRRYATIAEFADDLRRHLAGEAVHARPASWSYYARKFVVRNRLAVGAATTVVVALIAAATVSLWQAQVARQEARRADQVKKFVLSIFEEADTGSVSGGNRKTTAVELLKRAHERLAAVRVPDPSITVELLTSIGTSLIDLGEYKAAAEALEEATRLATATLKEGDPNTLAAQLWYGGALIFNDELRQAGPLLDTAERGMRRTGNAAGLIDALRWKSYLRAYEQRFDESIALAAEAVKVAEAHPESTDKRQLMNTYLTLAGAMGTVHRPGRLEPTRRAWELAREIYADRPAVPALLARSLYAYAQVVEGDAERGLSELKALLPQQIAVLGEDHIEVKESLARIGNASLALGDPLTAIDTYRQALRIEMAASGTHPTSGVGLQHFRLGGALATARRYAEAETELQEANRILTATLPPDHVEVRLAGSTTGLVLTRTGRLDEADAAFRPVLAYPLGNTLEAASIRLRLGPLRSAQGRHAEAQELLQQAADFFARQAIPSAHARALAALGEAQLDAGRFAEAFETLQRANTMFEKLQPGGSPDRADALVDLARANMALGRADDAVAAAEKAAGFWGAFDSTNRSTGVAFLWHARALNAAGDAQKAAIALHRADAILGAAGLPADRALLKQTQRESPAATRPSRR